MTKLLSLVFLVACGTDEPIAAVDAATPVDCGAPPVQPKLVFRFEPNDDGCLTAQAVKDVSNYLDAADRWIRCAARL